MSSRIRSDDAGPGSNPPPIGSSDAQRTPAEPVERREADSAAATPPEATEASQRPADGGAEGTERQPSETESERSQRRIDQLLREKHIAQRERDQIRNDWAAYQEQQRRAQQPPPSNDYERGRAEERDRRISEDFNTACNTLFAKGVQEYGDEMGDARDRLNAVGWGDRPDALAAVTQLPDGHRVYRELSRDLDNAARVLNLPPMAMAVELARLSGRETSGGVSRETMDNGAGLPPVSRAPEPTRPIGGNSRTPERPLDHPQVSMAEFIRRRDREERRSRISR